MTQRTLHGTKLKKIRVSGFRTRMASKTGRRVINARRKKGRLKLTV
tara:strand:+ start:419 stop:556 length:138 start_codon:yes stop_codon:yes gene_type:complete